MQLARATYICITCFILVAFRETTNATGGRRAATGLELGKSYIITVKTFVPFVPSFDDLGNR